MASRDHAWFEKIGYQEAEAIAGRRLDRRRQYYKHSPEGRAVDNPLGAKHRHAARNHQNELSEVVAGQSQHRHEYRGFEPPRSRRCG